MRIALGLEYDGSAFCGWQSQPGGCGVQDHLESALSRFADAPVTVVAAGRTDAGVHATGQVVHVDSDAKREWAGWVRGTNAHLPDGVRVVWAQPVPGDFHARFSARSRAYRYRLVDQPVAPALLRAQTGWFHQALDERAMHAAAQALLGTHDFSAFRDAQCQARSPVRTMLGIAIARRGPVIDISVRANGFLHHMVRNIVGSLVYVGAGRQPEAWISGLLQARDRRLAAPTFAATGLCLVHVDYDASLGFPPERQHPLYPLP
jgi:tRNA pseudouridine38-40 synthase